MALDPVVLNPGVGGDSIGTDNIGGTNYEVVKEAFGDVGSITLVSPTNPLPVTDAVAEAALASIAAEDFATQTTLAAILAKLSADPATQTTLAAILAKLIANPATDTLQTTGNTTLAAILAKIIAAPSTEAKQDTGNTSLASIAAEDFATAANQVSEIALLTAIDAGIPAALGQAQMVDSMPVVIASDQSPITVSISGAATDNSQIYSNTLIATGAISPLNTTGYASIVMQVSGVWSGSLILEGTNDTDNWEQLMVLADGEVSMQNYITSNGVYVIKSTTHYIRLNVLQLQTGGIYVFLVGRTVIGESAADRLSYAMDKVNGTPLYVSEVDTKKDIRNALIPSDAPAPIYGFGTAATGANSILCIIDTTGYNALSIQIFGTWVGTVAFTQSNDGVTFSSILGVNTAASTNIPLSATTINGLFMFPVVAKFIRVAVTAYTSGTMQSLGFLRQSSNAILSTPSFNIAQVAGTAVGVPSSLNSAGSANALNGLLPVGSTTAPGSSTVPYPIIVGGREAPSDGALGGKVRTLLTDILGKAIVTGDISASQSTQNVKSVPTQDQSQFEGQSMIELLAQILLELRINNQYMSDLPLVLRGQSGSFDEPQQFRNDNSLFAIQ